VRPLDVRTLANRWVGGDAEPFDTWGAARVLPARVRSGQGVGATNAVVHRVLSAAIVTDGEVSRLVARWACGSNSVNATPITGAETADYATCVHCTRAASVPTGPVVYRCYDESNDLLYIGSSIVLHSRIRSHRRTTAWWSDVHHIEAERFATEREARAAEVVAIIRERPLHNKVGNDFRAASP